LLPVCSSTMGRSKEKTADELLEEELEELAVVSVSGVDLDINATETATLARAAWEGRLLEVRQLLKDKADPNAFEKHSAGATRLTPLMAAAAGSRVDVVAELLVAGADPDVPSPAGVVAGDLAESHKKGQKISKLLAAFRVEIEEQLGGGASPPPADDAPDRSAAALAAAAAVAEQRREVVTRVSSKRGLAIVEKCLLGVARISAEACVGEAEDDDEDPDVQLAGDAKLTGEEARQARKRRQEEQETSRLQRVAERAAKRRGVDIEGERQARLAEKIAARRSQDPEQMRLDKIAGKAAERRSRLAAEDEAKQKKEKGKLDRLAQKSSERASARDVRAAQEKVAFAESEADRKSNPVVKRKVVESDVLICPTCHESSQRLTCGVCKADGMCQVCSKCYLCGRVSGFAAKVSKRHVPGMVESFL